MTQSQRLGWIGLGKMGVPICKRLAAAGHSVTALVRNDAGAERAAGIGIATVRSTAELAEQSSIIFSAVSDDAAMEDVVSGAGDLKSSLTVNHIFVEGSTVSPAASERVAKVLEGCGTPYIRAPFSGSTATAEAGKLTILGSGPEDAFETVRPLFEAYSAKQYYLGANEQARYMKLALNAMVGATSALVAESLNFGKAGGLDVASMVEVICNSAVSSPLIQYKAEMLKSGDFAPAFEVSQMVKDLDLVLSSGKAAELPMALVVRSLLDCARANGNGAKDFFVLAEDYPRNIRHT